MGFVTGRILSLTTPQPHDTFMRQGNVRFNAFARLQIEQSQSADPL